MIRYFEYAVSEGEGTLVSHRVKDIGEGYNGHINLWLNTSQIICEAITIERFLEFIIIHGSEVAV